MLTRVPGPGTHDLNELVLAYHVIMPGRQETYETTSLES